MAILSKMQRTQLVLLLFYKSIKNIKLRAFSRTLTDKETSFINEFIQFGEEAASKIEAPENEFYAYLKCLGKMHRYSFDNETKINCSALLDKSLKVYYNSKPPIDKLTEPCRNDDHMENDLDRGQNQIASSSTSVDDNNTQLNAKSELCKNDDHMENVLDLGQDQIASVNAQQDDANTKLDSKSELCRNDDHMENVFHLDQNRNPIASVITQQDDTNAKLDAKTELCRNDDHMENAFHLDQNRIASLSAKLDDIGAKIDELSRITDHMINVMEASVKQDEVLGLKTIISIRGKKENMLEAEECLLKLVRSSIENEDDTDIKNAVERILDDIKKADASTVLTDPEYKYETDTLNQDQSRHVAEVSTIAHKSPTFSTSLKDMYAMKKDSVTLGCELNQPDMPVKWLKDSHEIKPDDHIKISTRQTHQLEIRDVKFEDTATYSCVCGEASTECTINVTDGVVGTKKLFGDSTHDSIKRGYISHETETLNQNQSRLNAEVSTIAQKSPAFSTSLKDIYIQKKESVTLECELNQLNMPVKWLKDGQEIKPDDHIKLSLRQTHQLEIRDVMFEDTATYSCVCGNVSTECTFNVKDIRDLEEAMLTKDDDQILALLQQNNVPDRACVQRVYNLYRRNELQKSTFDKLLAKVYAYINSISNKIKFVTACFDEKIPDDIVFIVVATERLQLDIPYNTKFRLQDEYNDEAAFVTCHEKCRNKSLTSEESKYTAEILQKQADDIMKQHSNVQMISACSVRSRYFGTDQHTIKEETCIVIYVSVKGFIPVHEKVLPKTLQIHEKQFPVDVREGGMILFATAKDYHRDIKMGCLITGEKTYGTVGAFIDKGGKTYCLTCAHVFYDNLNLLDKIKQNGMYNHNDDYKQGCEVNAYQNVAQDPNFKFGEVSLAFCFKGDGNIPGVDLAVVEISDDQRKPLEGYFPDGDVSSLGYGPNVPIIFKSGMCYEDKDSLSRQVQQTAEVFMHGCESAFTKGVLSLEYVYARQTPFQDWFGNIPVSLHAQLVVGSIADDPFKPFACKGDSGAFVFAKHGGRQADLRAIGMVVGGTSFHTVFVTPIWAIFHYLSKNGFCSLKSFGEPMDWSD